MQSIDLTEDKQQSKNSSSNQQQGFGLVLSGGGSRGAYQVGALYALAERLKTPNPFSVITGTSLGAINAILLASGLNEGLPEAIEHLATLWRKRTFSNTFSGSISLSFVKAIRIAILRYGSPGPAATHLSVFNPKPLHDELSAALYRRGGLKACGFADGLESVAVTTTIEQAQRQCCLFVCTKKSEEELHMDGASFLFGKVEELTAQHGFASAALPSVLPSVDLDLDHKQVTLIDGGICDNHPVDPAVRLGADNLILIDSSGRKWWNDHYEHSHDQHPSWEVQAQDSTYCLRPNSMLECCNKLAFGPLLKAAVGNSRKDFLSALGPTWPIFRILRHKMGDELAYEVMSYVALHPQFTEALIELGYNETIQQIDSSNFLQSGENTTSPS